MKYFSAALKWLRKDFSNPGTAFGALTVCCGFRVCLTEDASRQIYCVIRWRDVMMSCDYEGSESQPVRGKWVWMESWEASACEKSVHVQLCVTVLFVKVWRKIYLEFNRRKKLIQSIFTVSLLAFYCISVAGLCQFKYVSAKEAIKIYIWPS